MAPPSTSFLAFHFARSTQTLGVDHYPEIEAALVSNMLSPALVEVCVVYDSVTAADNCSHLRHRLVANVGKVSLAPQAKSDASAKLTCIDRLLGQPSYLRMFEYAEELPLRGQTVLMANADAVVGDATVLQLAAGLRVGRVVVFGGRRPTGRSTRISGINE